MSVPTKDKWGFTIERIYDEKLRSIYFQIYNIESYNRVGRLSTTINICPLEKMIEVYSQGSNVEVLYMQNRYFFLDSIISTTKILLTIIW